MAVLTLSIPFEQATLRRLDEFAQREERNREDYIRELVDRSLRLKELEEVNAVWSAWAEEAGFTEEDLRREIKLSREER